MNAMKVICVAVCGWLLSTAACHRGQNDASRSQKANLVAAEPGSLTRAKASAPGVKFFGPGPVRPVPTVALEPVDLTTSVGQAPLRVRVSNLGAPVGADLLSRIARAVSLRTWPEQAAVPLVLAKIVDATGKSDADAYAHLDFTAASPLADRWYALAIDALPAGAGWGDPENTFPLPNGGRATRFRVGSGATVSSVRVYSKAQGQQLVRVDFSEPVATNTSLVTISYVGGNAPPCRPEANVAQVAKAPAGENATGMKPPQNAGAEPGITTIRLGCAEALDLGQEIRLQVQLGGQAAGAQAAAAGETLQFAIAPDSWVALEDGGKLFKPNL